MTGVDPFEERIQQNRIARNNRIYERQQIARRQRSPQEYVGYDAATGLHRLRGAEGDRLAPSITTGALESGAIVRSGPGSVDGLQAAQPLVFERERRSAPLSTRFYTISSNTLNENAIAVYQVDVKVPQKTAEIRVSYRWTPLDPTPEETELNSGVITNGLQLGNAQICCIPVNSLTPPTMPSYLVAANPALGTWVEIDSLPTGFQNLFWSYTLNSQGDRAYCGYTVNIGGLTWRTRIIEFSPTDYTIYRRIDAGVSDLRDNSDPPWTIAEVGGLLYVNGDLFGLLFIDLETEAKTVIFNTQDALETRWFIDGYETVVVQQVFKKDEQTIGVFLLSFKDGESYFGIATANISNPTNFSYELIYPANVGAEIDIENPKIFYSKKTRTYYFLGYPNVSTPSTGLEDYNYLGYWRSGDVPQFLKLRYAPGQSDEDRSLILEQWTNGFDELIFLNIDGRFEA